MSPDRELQEPLLEHICSSLDSEVKVSTSKKRKRKGDSAHISKKAAKQTKFKKPNEEDELDLEARMNSAFSHMDSQLLADYVAQRTKRYEDELSSIELEDKYIAGTFPPFHIITQTNSVSSWRDKGYHIMGSAKDTR